MKLLIALSCVLVTVIAASLPSEGFLDWLSTEGVAAYSRHVRIVGGIESVPFSRPFQAATLIHLDDGRTGFCGAAIVATTKLLTAAHCWDDGVKVAESITVIAGAHRWQNPEAYSQQQITSNVIIHPDWTPSLARNDIAVITLNTPLVFNEFVQPIALPSGSYLNDNFADETAIASGWGRDSDSAASVSPVLREVELKVLTFFRCRLQWFQLVRANNVCTSGADRRGTCQGDSGGPLFVYRDEAPLLIGLTSFGSPAGCEIDIPSVYARITSFITWINSHL